MARNMKTVGLIGGIGPESTIEYYRLIISGYRERTGVAPAEDARGTGTSGSYPSIIINSVDVARLVGLMTANQLDQVTEYLTREIKRLANAGADFAALAANTPHIVFDELSRRSQIPLLSIVEATCTEAQSLGLKRIALLGTRFTMQANFYREVFSRSGLTIVAPNVEEQTWIHEKYTGELLSNVFLPETREQMLVIIERMKKRDSIEAVILGGTELPLLLRDSEYLGLPLLDTTRIHVKGIVAELVS
jgi:aspartate racemase